MKKTVDRLTVVLLVLLAGVWMVRWMARRDSEVAPISAVEAYEQREPPPRVGQRELSREYLYDLGKRGIALGADSPSATVIAFFDYSCGYCKVTDSALQVLMDRFPDHLQVSYVDLVLSASESVLDVHAGARCAQQLGAFNAFHRAAFEHQELVPLPNGWLKIAQLAGIEDERTFARCVLGGAATSDVISSTREADALGFDSTPVLIVGHKVIVGSAPIGVIESAIRDEILGRRQVR